MKISVIVPVYNASEYVRTCLDSILATPLDDMEVIAVDDGSTDGSAEILDSYSDARLHVIHQKNAGASSARNAGIDAANGEYIGFVDADDWVEPLMFKTLYDSAVQYDADIVFCNIYRNENEKMRRYLDDGLYDEAAIRDKIFPLLISNTDEQSGKVVLRGAVWCKIFRSRIVKENNIRFDPSLIYNEDGLFSIAATLSAKQYLYLGSEYLYHSRNTPGSITKRYINDLWNRQKKIGQLLTELTETSEYDFSAQISKKIFETAIYCAENECKSTAPLTEKDRKKKIREIVSDPLLRGSLKMLDTRKLKRINKAYCAAFRLNMPLLVKATAYHRNKKHSDKR